MGREFLVRADGGARGNPGAAAFGAVVYENGKVIKEIFETIGIASNNVAEYRGLIAGLNAVHSLDPNGHILVEMDSKLVIEQMSGNWKIKHPDMRTLAKQARDIHDPKLVKYKWIPRGENSAADALVNQALDGEVAKSTPHRVNFLTERFQTSDLPTTIYFVRHGETILTPQRRFSGIGEINPELTEIFDSSPFKTDFKFNEDLDSIYTDTFLDPQGNKIKIYFHKYNNQVYLLDFTVNGHSGKSPGINYSLKQYTVLLSTIGKSINQFIKEYKPKAIKIEGEDSSEKINKGKEGQKINIYDYFISTIDITPDYLVGDRKPDGSFSLVRKPKV